MKLTPVAGADLVIIHTLLPSRFELAASHMELLFDLTRLTAPYETSVGGAAAAASPFGPRFRHAVTGQLFGAFFVECPNVGNRGWIRSCHTLCVIPDLICVVTIVLLKAC
jgi:hypothetical protein